MLISVVIPLYNKEKYILRAIQSVLKQSYQNFEIIIIDDGSIDGSKNIVKSIADQRIHLFSQENAGASNARNNGVQYANADWVGFLDADDEYDSGFLEQVALFINDHKNNDLSIVGTNYYIGSRSNIAFDLSIQSGIYDYFKLFQKDRTPNNSSSTVVNRNKFWEVNGFPEDVELFEDWAAWVKLSFIGEFGYINTPLSFYHHVDDAVTSVNRSSLNYYHDAVQFALMIKDYVHKYPFTNNNKENALHCVNAFLINNAKKLSKEGAKRSALEMLRLMSIRYFEKKQLKDFRSFLLHLFVPQWVKKIYWTLKAFVLEKSS